MRHRALGTPVAVDRGASVVRRSIRAAGPHGLCSKIPSAQASDGLGRPRGAGVRRATQGNAAAKATPVAMSMYARPTIFRPGH
jgi:hypothetical protein